MTLVEFFSKKQIENVISSLLKKPDRVIFVGYEENMTSPRKKSTSNYLKSKNINAHIEFVNIKKHSLKDAVEKLTRIYLNNEECVFDFTGGEELIIAGMGYVMAKYNVKAMEVNVLESLVYGDLNVNDNSEKFSIKNSVYENLKLHGGTIDLSKQKSSKYNLSDSFKKDVYGLWDICRINNTMWNSTSGIFKTLDINRYPLDKVNLLFDRLKEKGFIKTKKQKSDYIPFEYKNRNVEFCLKDPGVILELYTYFVLKECPEFNDVQVGVTVDWDGIIHNMREKSKDTANEIDVVAMKGIIPVYISCKNGKVTKETLYELETVSRRFGGIYSERILVAPILNEESISHEYLKNRAGDMGIKVITDVSQISKEKYKNRILKSMGM